MTQVCAVSGPLGAAAVAAALDAGLLGAHERRVLLACGDPVPDALAARFDEVLDWQAEFGPLAPSGWMPRPQDLPVLEQWLRGRWRLPERLDLVLESVADRPGRALAAVLSDAALTVCAGGLAVYGPTPELLPDAVGSRVARIVHLDLVPGVAPLLLHERAVPVEAVPDEAVRKVLAELAAGDDPAEGPVALLLAGRHEGLPFEDESGLRVAMLRGLAARGLTRIRVAGQITTAMRLEASRLALRLAAVDGPAEAWAAAERPALTVGVAEPALFAAQRFLGLPVASLGARRLLQDGDPVAAALADTLLPRLGADGVLHSASAGPEEVAPLLSALAYTLQTGTLPELRAGAARYLGGPDALHRYFAPDRLAALDLPGPGWSRRVRRHLLRTDRP